MNIQDLIDLFIEEGYQKFQIFDLDAKKIIFDGYGNEIPYKISIKTILSIDTISNNKITINI